MRSPLFALILCCLPATLLPPARVHAAEVRAEFVMFSDPPLPVIPEEFRLNPRLLPLWREALAHPEGDLQRQAAASIAQARELGFPDLAPAIPDLVRILSDEQALPAARHAAAHALIALDHRDAAPLLFDVARRGTADLRQLVEPALSAWRFEPIRPVWRARLTDAHPRRRELLLACQGLGQAQDTDSLSALIDITLSALRPADVRLAAARAAAVIADTGLERSVRTLRAGDAGRVPLINRLCAVNLLVRHRGDEAQKLLADMAVDADPVVAAAALRTLHSISPELVLPLVEGALRNPDPHVRQCGVDAYVAVPTPDRVVRIADLLDDVHPDVRRNVCVALLELAAQPDLDAAVRGSGLDVLGRDGWRGQEQAALLLGALDHEPAAPRIMELLDAPRAEIKIACGWALRELAIPETLPAIHKRVQQLTEARLSQSLKDSAGIDEQIAYLFETLGQMRYRPAEAVMRQHVPKNFALGYYARAAAVWSLGLLHAGQPDEELAAQLVERFRDVASMPPEVEPVREMCVMSLGRMGAASALPTLREFLGPTVIAEPMSLRLRWAVMLLADEDLPLPSVVIKSKSGWFLEPLQ